MKILKLVLFNISYFLIFFFVIELFFGYWFDKDNLGPYMREHRMKKSFYSLKYKNETYEYIYKRNYHGFRGEEIDLSKIQAVFIGGSTADERYKPDDYTIVGNLNKKFLNDKIDLKIINAGIEGQSTRGHLYNFEVWFPKLKGFSPDYFIFYVGINDHQLATFLQKQGEGNIKNQSLFESTIDNFKSRSIFYDLLRKTKHKYKNKGKKVYYDFNYGVNNYLKGKKYKFLDYETALKKYDVKKMQEKNKKLINFYLDNIDQLVNYSNALNAKPIFINQLTYEGNYNKELFILNYSLISHCKKKNYFCIDLGKNLVGKKEYWWDGIHTTPLGSQVISDIIFPDLKSFIN